ncbi:helix-turn-helix transcriptional regulator [Streptomyces sp. NPDC057694]|uniref:helix-turn-helix domain-containing protein n=1 Tax=unclassified Streptomyces TaxID=2593676 RepID=UPI0036B31B01
MSSTMTMPMTMTGRTGATAPAARWTVSGTPCRLTRGERRIAELAATGLTVEEIGELTGLPRRTVSTQLYRILPRLGVTTRASVRGALDRLDAPRPADGTRACAEDVPPA